MYYAQRTQDWELKAFVEVLYLSVLLYGCDSWTVKEIWSKSLRQQKCDSGER